MDATYTVTFKGFPEKFIGALEKMLRGDIVFYPKRMQMDSAGVERQEEPARETKTEPKPKAKKNAAPKVKTRSAPRRKPKNASSKGKSATAPAATPGRKSPDKTVNKNAKS